MVARLNQFQRFTNRENFLSTLMQTPEVYIGEKPRTRVFPNQLCNRRLAITGNLWEDLFGDREDVPNGLVRKPIVENSCFVRSGSESLDNQWSCGSVQVIADLGLVLH